jgi:reverse transcriptase-like protein
MDLRPINNVTKSDENKAPLQESVRERIRGAKYFTRLDMRDGYHHLRIKEGHEKRTAFLTEYGLYEWTVMCFGLKNAPAQFARYMNDNLKEFLKEFVVIYFDDIMIYSNDLESHRERISDQQRYQVMFKDEDNEIRQEAMKQTNSYPDIKKDEDGFKRLMV